MPPDLNNKTFSKKIYYYNPNNKLQNVYLEYVRLLYNLDVTPGMTFRDTEEELQKLDFSNTIEKKLMYNIYCRLSRI